MKRIIRNIPNMITMSRMISSIVAPILLVTGNIGSAVGLYIYGGISDCLDGLAARTLKAHTELGKLLDPLSDKIYAASLLIPSLLLGNYLMIIPLILEGEIAATNIAASKSGILIETERVGKYKTCLLFASLIVGLIAPYIKEFYILLAPLLMYTTHFQIQSIHAYENQYHDKMMTRLEEKKSIVESKEIEKEKAQEKKQTNKQLSEKIKDEISIHYHEFKYYENIPIESKLSSKPKKLQRKLKR